MDSIVKVEGLGKKYVLGRRMPDRESYDTLRDIIWDAARKALCRLNGRTPKQDGLSNELWALKDVNFEVGQGERLGVVGRNGAGKSTLLKIVSRITRPTTGKITIHGRVASLLEVGTGFHPELTGRENIFLNGAILGMGRAEIKRKFDDIVEFSEIERFLDTPVKRYSSGMYVRLAFAVAAHLDPEILLVDEVLAVGDIAFQKKCLGKMGEVTTSGRTVIFVSHNMAAVQSLCGRAIWLDHGRIAEIGEASKVVADYLQADATFLTEQVWDDISTAPGNDKVRICRACVRAENGGGQITVHTPFRLEFDYWNLEPDARIHLCLHIYNAQGVLVINPAPVNEPVWHGRPFPVGLFRTICCIPGDLMNDNTYRVNLMVVKDGGKVIYTHEDILAFDIFDDPETRGEWRGKVEGVVRPKLDWTTDLVIPGLPSRDAASIV
ncbi:MAG: ABC transporter ATP-binding protein [Armatimonadota bacterium]|nr:ABC transporter ATP-binding protein [Armatimonadota bacterium]